tara:strand:- start:5559 stop:5708 length:150 start_codon:yes stop_codon:yes gene_type:complete
MFAVNKPLLILKQYEEIMSYLDNIIRNDAFIMVSLVIITLIVVFSALRG